MAYQNTNFDHLAELVRQRRWDELRRLVAAMDPADVADLLEELDPEDRDVAFDMLDLETAGDVLAELEAEYLGDVMEDMPSDRIASLARHMAPDEAVELLEEMDSDASQQVLAAMAPRERAALRHLLGHREESAGRIMTPEICAVPPETTVRQVQNALRQADLSDPVFNVYVVDPETDRLLGIVTVTDLLVADPDATVYDISERDYVFAASEEDQEEVARKFRKYNLWVLPVVDAQHRLIGRITADDVIDVFHEEADEDLAHMVGAPDIEEEEQSPLRIARMRFPWLLITMSAGLVNSVIIKTMLNVTDVVAIAVFVPVILAMGGNTGMQSSAVAVRGIALGLQAYGKLLKIVFREVRVGLALGLACGSLTAALVGLVLHWTAADTGDLPPAVLACTVGLAMCNAMAFASAFGSIVPILLHRMGVDPALASGPFVTTSNDLSASLIYFATCAVLLGLA